MIDNIKDFIEEKHYEYTFNEWLKKQIFARDKEIERLNNDYLEMKDNFRTANDEIERLNNIINTSIDKVQEVKEHIDKSKFDGTTKSILIMALNEIIYSLNGKGVDKG